MNKWINISDEVPTCYRQGNWDGKQSDLVLAETVKGLPFIACCYEGLIDGESFYDWYQVDEINQTDYLIESKDIARWMKITF